MGNKAGSSMGSVEDAEARFSADDLAHVRAGFRRLCKLTNDEELLAERVFRQHVLLDCLPDMPLKLVSRIFLTFAANGNAYLDYAEFLCGLCVLAKGSVDERLQFLFHVYDVQQTGKLTRDVLIRFDEMIRKTCLYKDEGHWSGLAAVEELFTYTAKGEMNIRSTLPQNSIRSEIQLEDFLEWGAQYPDSPLVKWLETVGEKLMERSPMSASGIEGVAPTTAESATFGKSKLSPLLVAKPRSGEEQRDSFQGEEFRKVYKEPNDFHLGEEWFLIEKRWFLQWSFYSGFLREQDHYQVAQVVKKGKPGNIDNSKLAPANPPNEDTTPPRRYPQDFVELRRDVYYKEDYFVLNKPSWMLLLQWYGGGPSVKRRVVLSPGSSKPDLEIYPVKVQLEMVGIGLEESDARTEMFMSRVDKLRELKRRALEVHGLRSDRAVTMWSAALLKRQKVYKPVLLSDLDQTVEDANFRDGQLVLLEDCQENDSAAKPSPRLLRQFSSSCANLADLDPDLSDEVKQQMKQLGVKGGGAFPYIPGVKGLQNLGNTCYMNAAVQCLAHTPPFKYYFLSGAYINDLNPHGKTGAQGRLADAFGDLMRLLWRIERKEYSLQSVAPRRLKKALSSFEERFTGMEQHDAQELLSSLLYGLGEDLNRVVEKPFKELADSNDRPDEQVAREWWSNHVSRELCIVTALFTGQFKSLLTCSSCGFQSARFEPFVYLSLPFPSSSGRNMVITVITRCATATPTLYAVHVKATDTFEAVLQALSYSKGDWRFAEVYDRQVVRHIPMDREIARVRDGTPLFLYESTTVEGEGEEEEEGELLAGKRVIYKNPRTDELHACVVIRRPVEGVVDLLLTFNGSNGRQRVKTRASVDSVTMQSKSKLDLVLWQRQWQPSEVHFCNPFRPVVVGFPFLLSVDPEKFSGKELYEEVVQRLGLDTNRGEKENSEDDQGDDDVEEEEAGGTFPYPFKLLNTRAQGGNCAFCSWTAGCAGCEIPVSDSPLSLTGFSDALTVCIDWGLAREETSIAACTRGDVLERQRDVSFERMKQDEGREIGLDDLLDDFTSREELEGEDGVFCSRCERKENQSKQIQIWRAPPVLVIHLGRFEHTAYRHRKLKHFVRYPLKGLDLSRYMVPCSPAHETQPKSSHLATSSAVASNGYSQEAPLAASAAVQKEQSAASSTLHKGDELKEDLPNGRGKPVEDSTLSFDLFEGNSQEDREESVNEAEDEGGVNAEEVEALLDSDYLGLQCYGGSGHGGHSKTYNLYAVVEHSGGVGAGHYVAVVKHEADGNWYCFDDERVFPIQPENVVSRNAYLLFYIRSDIDNADALEQIFPCHPVQQQEMETRMKQSQDVDDDEAWRCATM